MIHLKSVFLRFVLPPVVCCGAIAFAQNTLDSKANEPISSAPVASGSVLTPAPVLAPTPVVPAEIATPVPVAPEIIDEEPQDYSLADESAVESALDFAEHQSARLALTGQSTENRQ